MSYLGLPDTLNQSWPVIHKQVVTHCLPPWLYDEVSQEFIICRYQRPNESLFEFMTDIKQAAMVFETLLSEENSEFAITKLVTCFETLHDLLCETKFIWQDFWFSKHNCRPCHSRFAEHWVGTPELWGLVWSCHKTLPLSVSMLALPT
jgi:hypothetical protein